MSIKCTRKLELSSRVILKILIIIIFCHITHPYMDINFVRMTILSVREINPSSIDLKQDENIIRTLEQSSSLYGSEVGLLSYHQKLPHFACPYMVKFVNMIDTEIFSTKTYRKLVLVILLRWFLIHYLLNLESTGMLHRRENDRFGRYFIHNSVNFQHISIFFLHNLR